jgi:hypothetical protein
MQNHERSNLTENDGFVAVLAGLSATCPLLFAAAFFVILPARGLELERLGDAAHILEVFGANRTIIQLVCCNNALLLFSSGLVAALLPRRLNAPNPELALLAGALAASGWALYFVGELFDFTAYLSLPAYAPTHPASALQAFATLQHGGRVTHAFAYLVIGIGLGGTAWHMARGGRWPRWVPWLGFTVCVLNLAIFGVEYLSSIPSGDAGTGGWFNVLLALDTLLVACWHGSLAWRLRTARTPVAGSPQGLQWSP